MIGWDKARGMIVFALVVETGSMTSAAEKLMMTASAVSQHIRQLEQMLGVTLLYRSTRKISLSDAGKHFLPHAMQIYHAFRLADAGVQQYQDEPSGQIKMTAPLGLGHGPLNDVLIEFMAQYPAVQVELDCSDKPRDLIAEGYDLAIRVGPLADSSLIAQRLTSCRMIAVATPAYLDQCGHPEHPEQLGQYRWISSTKDIDLALHHRDGRHWQGNLSVHRIGSDILLQRRWCLSGFGISLQPESEIVQQLHDEALTAVLPDWSSPSVGLYAVTPSREYSPAIRYLIDALKVFFKRFSRYDELSSS